MSEKGPDYAIRSSSSGTVGRSLNAIRNHHVVIDSPSIGEAITSGEAFLSGVSACAVTLTEGAARELGIPLRHTEVTLDAYRAPDRPAFERVEMHFVFDGPTQEQAEILVNRYKDG